MTTPGPAQDSAAPSRCTERNLTILWPGRSRRYSAFSAPGEDTFRAAHQSVSPLVLNFTSIVVTTIAPLAPSSSIIHCTSSSHLHLRAYIGRLLIPLSSPITISSTASTHSQHFDSNARFVCSPHTHSLFHLCLIVVDSPDPTVRRRFVPSPSLYRTYNAHALYAPSPLTLSSPDHLHVIRTRPERTVQYIFDPADHPACARCTSSSLLTSRTPSRFTHCLLFPFSIWMYHRCIVSVSLGSSPSLLFPTQPFFSIPNAGSFELDAIILPAPPQSFG